MGRRELLEETCRAHGVLCLYLFGSRAADGIAVLADSTQLAHLADGSDFDVGVFFARGEDPILQLPLLQVALEDVFAPLKVDLVPLQRVDALFQAAAIDGHRAFAADADAADLCELVVMRRAAELLPIQRAIERDRFGTSTS
jgi:predicted nucleotidyltransferase